jgi:hypothetical protein
MLGAPIVAESARTPVTVRFPSARR